MKPPAEQHGTNLPRLVEVMRRLLAPDGCPWDRAQSASSLRPYILEEACEVIDAIDREDPDALREELGDLLMQIVFQAELARGEGRFGPDDVIEGICEKLERRHPHVFGSAVADTPEQVRRNWEAIKAHEKSGRGQLEGVPRSLPALARAQRLGERAARVGFDWPDRTGCRDKVTEELGELDEAIASGDTEAIRGELGDLIFSIVNLARHVGVDAELALRATSDKFVARFEVVEAEVRKQHGGFEPNRKLDIETLDRYWEAAKRGEAGT